MGHAVGFQKFVHNARPKRVASATVTVCIELPGKFRTYKGDYITEVISRNPPSPDRDPTILGQPWGPREVFLMGNTQNGSNGKTREEGRLMLTTESVDNLDLIYGVNRRREP